MKKIFLGIFLIFWSENIFAKLELNEAGYEKILTGNKITKNIAAEKSESAIRNFLNEDNIKTINFLLGSVALIWIAVLAAKFVISQGKEENLSKYRQQFGWIVVGFFVISIAEFAAFEVFDPTAGNDILAGETEKNFSDKIFQIIEYVNYFVTGLILLMLGYSGFHLVVDGGNDSAVDEEIKFIKNGLFGIILILLPKIFVEIFAGKNSLDPTKETENFSAEFAVERGLVEAAGVINYALTFLSIIAIFMLVLSSIYFVSSLGNDNEMQRARRIITGSIIGLVIAFSSFTITNLLIK